MDLDKRAFRIALWADLAVILFTVVHGLIHSGNPSRYFGEGRYTTAVSCFQLLLTAWFAFGVFRVRRAASADRGWRAGFWVWLLMGAGFVFLACDDAFQFHEHMEKLMNQYLHLPKNELTDRLDDAIIGVYGLIGLWVLWLFRRELLAFRCMMRPLLIGFGFMFLSVVFDSLGHRADIFEWLTGDVALAKRLQGLSDVGDGAFTLLAEGMFAVGFYCGRRRAAEV